MGLNVLGYKSYLLQRYLPACGIFPSLPGSRLTNFYRDVHKWRELVSSGVVFLWCCYVFFCFCFCFVFVFKLSLKPRPFVQSFFDIHACRQPHELPNSCLHPFLFLCLLFFSFLFSFLFPCFFGDVAFSEYFLPIVVFSLYGEYAVGFFLPDGGFLPCDHGLDF